MQMIAIFMVYEVVTVRKDDCVRPATIEIAVEPKSERHLASVVTEETGCGSLDTPWLLRAPPGHTIKLHLLDFETAGRATVHVPHVCQVSGMTAPAPHGETAIFVSSLVYILSDLSSVFN
jgi:hypothetical protein